MGSSCCTRMSPPSAPSRRVARPRAYALLDTMFGMALAVALIMLFAQAVGQHRRSERQLSDRRAALHTAESVLTAMQGGGAAPTVIDGMDVDVIWLDDIRRDGGAVPSRHRWARIEITRRDQRASLAGMVPRPRPGEEASAP